MPARKIIIVGGGLAGLITSIHLTRAGVPCTVIERESYPFHRVCGEYISNEVEGYLRQLDVFPYSLDPSAIRRFQLTSVNGRSALLSLPLGGFGVSRYRFDHFLFEKARAQGVDFLLNTEVENITFAGDGFMVQTSREMLDTDVVVGAFGKRSRLDNRLKRPFAGKRSPYAAVKYHIRMEGFPDDLIALHNFYNGYCGISHIEGGNLNLCYLTHRNNLRIHGNIRSMEEAVLFKNPFLKRIFSDAEFLLARPETINEISFQTKAPVEQHILFAGDAAGMITPLCGNGMAMAIHAAKILSEHILRFCTSEITREQMEQGYAEVWRKTFESRLRTGRLIQGLFGSTLASNIAVNIARHVRPLARYLVSKTHGPPLTK